MEKWYFIAIYILLDIVVDVLLEKCDTQVIIRRIKQLLALGIFIFVLVEG